MELAPQAGFEPATLRLTVAAERFSVESYRLTLARKFGLNECTAALSLAYEITLRSDEGEYSFVYNVLQRHHHQILPEPSGSV